MVVAIGALTGRLSTGRNGLTLPERRARVDTRPFTRLTRALLEYAIVVVGRFVPVATHRIVHMRAPTTGIGSFAKASAETVFVCTDKVLPFGKTLPVTPRTSVDQPTDGVPRSRGTMRIQFSTLVPSLDVHLRKVTMTRNLDVLRGLEEVGTMDRAVRNQARTVARLETVRDENLSYAAASR